MQKPKAKSQWPSAILCFCRRFLLLGYRALARSFTRTRVGVRTLSANRQVAAMTKPAIRADFNQPLDVHGDVLAQITFHVALGFNGLADAVDLIFVQVLDLLHRLDF